MKRTAILNLFIISLLLVGATACKKRPTGITHIPGQKIGMQSTAPTGPDSGGVFNPAFEPDPATGSIPFANQRSIDGRPQDRSKFANNTVYFELDSFSVKASEKAKIEEVAAYFKSNQEGDLLVEGHCDERGTEGYNLSLGDRRANALREYLVNLGVSAERVHIVSFGESRPAGSGGGEESWSKNRRGEFVFVEPAK